MILLRAETKVFLVVEQVVDFVAFKRNTECEERFEGSAGVVFRGPNKDIKIIGGAEVAVCVYGNPPTTT